jgi:hypothetical protein
MTLPSKAMLKRLIAVALCLLALNIYVAFSPKYVLADNVCDCMHCGLCNNLGQQCRCLYVGTQCTGGEWIDYNGCKCKQSC